MRFRKSRIIPVALVIVCGILLHSCLTFRTKPSEIEKFFQSKHVSGRIDNYKVGRLNIQFAQTGDSTKPLVLFVHGSPGSLDAFTGFLVDSTLLEKAFLVTTDRPGFGYTDFGNGEPSLKKQADLIASLIRLKQNGHPVILVGHSLGGPLIAKVVIDYPDLVDGLVIVAGSIDPELEPNESWWRGPLATPFLSFLLPRSFRASNVELYHLKPALEDMLSQWSQITCPVVVIHGKKDIFVPFENVEFAKSKLANAPVRYILHDTASHFIPWSHPELMNEGILSILQDAEGFRSARHSAVH
jgi:pimeloyl-ACP methyl ester carboxylesterase